VYKRIDSAIGEILRGAGDCRTFVFSSHGMSHWYGANFLLQEILVRLGVTQPRDEPERARSPASLTLAAGEWTWHLLPRALRRRLAGIRRRLGPAPVRNDSRLPSIDADPAYSKCFHHRNGLAIAGIRLNIIGREPLGIVKPGAEAEAFSRSLADDLLAIVDKRTGRPLVDKVIRVSDHYRGPRLAHLPDLLVEYNDQVPIGSAVLGTTENASIVAYSPKIGVVEDVNTYGRSGEHRPEGLLIAAGPGIAMGTFEQPVSVLDLAPTWTSSLGVEMEDTDGTAIQSVAAAV
jgi:predicted AlkP superfamily phosphohydrolase/phosphomutase